MRLVRWGSVYLLLQYKGRKSPRVRFIIILKRPPVINFVVLMVIEVFFADFM